MKAINQCKNVNSGVFEYEIAYDITQVSYTGGAFFTTCSLQLAHSAANEHRQLG